jgi:hypothetical protein
MCKVLISNKLIQDLKDGELEEITEYSFKIENIMKSGNKGGKIEKVSDSLLRIHLDGSSRRMYFSYEKHTIKIYGIIDTMQDKEKNKQKKSIIELLTKLKDIDFIDVTPQKKDTSKEEVGTLKEILKVLENSALMAIPENGKLELSDLMIRFEKQKWVRKYSKMKQLFYKLRHDKGGDKKLMKILKDIKKRDLEEKLINNLSKLNSSALQKEVNARFENKKQIKISEQLIRRVK